MEELYSRTLEEGVWRYLDLFSQLAYLEKATGSLKRANLINLCLRQGKEYYQTSKEATVLTKPLLLFYGMLNLSKALILLRKPSVTPDNFQYHGLTTKPKNGSPPATRRSLMPLWCRVSGGVFPQLLRCGTKERYNMRATTGLRQVIIDKTTQYPRQPQLAEENVYCVSEIIAVIPELFQLVLDHTKIQPRMAQIHDFWFIQTEPGRTSPTQHPAARLTIRHDRQERIKETVRSFDKRQILKDWKLKEDYLNTFRYEIHSTQNTFHHPDIRETLFGEQFGLFDSRRKMKLPEIIMHYLLMFILGTAARYIPDLWCRVMEKKVNERIIVETFLNTSEIKFPLLLLRELRDELIYFRTA